jgi:hypothetical protein
MEERVRHLLLVLPRDGRGRRTRVLMDRMRRGPRLRRLPREPIIPFVISASRFSFDRTCLRPFVPGRIACRRLPGSLSTLDPSRSPSPSHQTSTASPNSTDQRTPLPFLLLHLYHLPSPLCSLTSILSLLCAIRSPCCSVTLPPTTTISALRERVQEMTRTTLAYGKMRFDLSNGKIANNNKTLASLNLSTGDVLVLGIKK